MRIELEDIIRSSFSIDLEEKFGEEINLEPQN